MSRHRDIMAGAWRLADNRIREAMGRGEFDDLPGAGKPLPGLDQPYDPMWWVKKKIAAEQLKVTQVEAEAIMRVIGGK